MKRIFSIEEIINKYDTFILDQWGVIHDGKIGYAHAKAAIEYLEYKNKNLVIVSNSSKRKKTSAQRLPGLGFNQKAFKEVLTSGEMIWQMIFNLMQTKLKKKNCLHIFDERKEDGLNFRNGLDEIYFVENVNEADFIIACTPYHNSKPIDYIPMLNAALKKGLIMFCANPDFQTIEGNINTFCMGVIAELYKRIGGEVIIKGKPEIDIYIESTKCVDLNKSKTVAIGDSLFHDIKGAQKFNIDSVLVKSGIHQKEDIDKLIRNHEINPSYLIDNFSL